MSNRALIVLIVAWCFTTTLIRPAPAEGSTVVTGSARAWQFQRWIDKAMVPTPELELEVRDARCVKPDAVACAAWDAVYLSPALVGGMARQTLLHEIGHVYDREVLTDERRAELAGVMGWVGPWDQFAAVGHASPNEQFANLYSDCALARSLSPYRPWSRGTLLPKMPHRVKARACAVLTG